ncbi:MAG: acetylornithine deacetylase [Phycisphaerales bacterium]
MIDSARRHLERLVAFDTRNPPRSIPASGGIIDYLREALGSAFESEVIDLGDGCVNLFATRGRPRLLLNVHLDTVPAAEGWSSDPLVLRDDGERLIGLGATDIKGAAAALLAALESTDDPVAVLFTTDEEAGESRCVRKFLEEFDRGEFDATIVAEPTECRAVVAHRGLVTGVGAFHGVAGHSASGRALLDSAIHEAMRWGEAALTRAAAEERRESFGLRGICFNIGRVEGGVKPNMIATSATVRWSARPRPGQSAASVRGFIESAASSVQRVSWTPGFDGPALPTDDREEIQAAAEGWARARDLEIGAPVDFWTEAALFSAAGWPAIVLGPGHIGQAHTPDEYLSVAELNRAADTYARLLSF